MTEKPDAGRSRERGAARALGSAGVLALFAIGACRQIFGLDEAVSYTPDTAATDGGTGAVDGSPMDPVTQMASGQLSSEQSPSEQSASGRSQPLGVADAAPDAAAGEQAQLCNQYCGSIETVCVGDDKAYANDVECQALCRQIPPGSPGEYSGNTLTCRMQRLATDVSEDPQYGCNGAGRGGEARGDALCGSNCEAYCDLMAKLCPSQAAELQPSCQVVCSQIGDNDYLDVDRDGMLDVLQNTVQCRLRHLGLAAVCQDGDTDCRQRHCHHAAGASPCCDPADPSCAGDAGH